MAQEVVNETGKAIAFRFLSDGEFRATVKKDFEKAA